MNLIIIEKHELLDASQVILTGQRFKHIRDVLRCKVGSIIEVGMLSGKTGTAEILEITRKHTLLKCEFINNLCKSPTQLDVICALPRPQTLKSVLQISAAMGVSNIHIIRANKVEPCYFNASAIEPSQMRKHLIKGLSQGKNTLLPEIHIHKRFKNFISKTLPAIYDNKKTKISKLLFDPYAKDMIGSKHLAKGGHIIIAIGPEGGWVPFEIDFMSEHGFKSCLLGPWPLRVEHALVSAISQIELVMADQNK